MDACTVFTSIHAGGRGGGAIGFRRPRGINYSLDDSGCSPSTVPHSKSSRGDTPFRTAPHTINPPPSLLARGDTNNRFSGRVPVVVVVVGLDFGGAREDCQSPGKTSGNTNGSSPSPRSHCPLRLACFSSPPAPAPAPAPARIPPRTLAPERGNARGSMAVTRRGAGGETQQVVERESVRSQV